MDGDDDDDTDIASTIVAIDESSRPIACNVNDLNVVLCLSPTLANLGMQSGWFMIVP